MAHAPVDGDVKGGREHHARDRAESGDRAQTVHAPYHMYRAEGLLGRGARTQLSHHAWAETQGQALRGRMRYAHAADGQKAEGSVEEGEGRVGCEQLRMALPPLPVAWMHAMQRDMHHHPYLHHSCVAYAYPPYNRAGAPMPPLKAHLPAPVHKNQLARPAAAAAQRVPLLRAALARPQP